MAKNVQQNYASQAHLTMALVSPQRCRLVADLVRGRSLETAHRTLLLEKVKSAKIILTLLKSAMANAQQKGVADLDRLYVSEIQVNEGPRIKRHMPRAQGRAECSYFADIAYYPQTF
jgi:large subunit ribosomal protein L22